MVKVDPSLIEGPQLAFAAQHERILTFEINEANNWCLPRTFLLVLLPFPSADVLLAIEQFVITALLLLV